MHFTGNDVCRILVDNSSAADILVWQCFVKMVLTKKHLHQSQYTVIGFGGKKIEALGKVELNVTFVKGNTLRTEAINFDVVDISYPYNAMFGCNTIIKFAAEIHQPHLCMKIPIAGGVTTVFGNQEEARRCEGNASYTTKNVHAIEVVEGEAGSITRSPKPKEAQKAEGVAPAEHNKKVLLCEDVPDRTVIIGKDLDKVEEARLI